ncbi:MAG: hypothetical protein K9M56_04320 [Victivallales bacterium]|nr:hypothetical protein [Victivallales bacterium]
MARKGKKYELTPDQKLYVKYYAGTPTRTLKKLRQHRIKHISIDQCKKWDRQSKIVHAIDRRFYIDSSLVKLNADIIENGITHEAINSENGNIRMRAWEGLARIYKMFVDVKQHEGGEKPIAIRQVDLAERKKLILEGQNDK